MPPDLLPPASAFGLPHSWREYAVPETYRKARAWLNARWQLRQCNEIGRWARFSGRAFISNQGYIGVGERVQFLSRYVPSMLTVFPGGRLEIGDRTSINHGADFAATGLIRIGRDCRIGTYVIILDNDFHDLEDRSRRPAPKPVIIEDDVWVGNRAIILPGVKIGRGSVIGAGSVVLTDIPEHSLAMGNPARVIKRL